MIKTGIGIDAHRLVKGRRLILGGVPIEYPLGLEGHSDADVLCHALADALLGAIADGDIGMHFPDTEPRWKDANSLDLLAQVVERLKTRRARVVHVDAVLMAEAPKLAPYRQAMREGLMDVFMDAGAVISPPTCGPCLGGHMGVLAEGERAVATTNRNFAGRMGHRRSEVVLAGPAVAAASAVLGRVGSPEELK